MFLEERGYYLIATLIIAAAVLWFVVSFERKKPQEREVVMLAVMTAIAVVGRAIFFMTPQIKPCAAIIIITAVMLGKQAGFLCGVLTAFISDFMFGQGPWTPWQMIAFGIVGLGAAIIFEKREQLRNNKVLLCIYGFISTAVAYGLIMDTSTVLMYMDKPRLASFIAVYTSGIIFNVIHGLATVVILWILAEPMFRKINRIKIKYGMYLN